MRRAAAVASTLLLALALGGLTRVPWVAGDPSVASIRLSWRFRGEAVRECRPLTEEERAELPVHMRREEVCERRIAPYRLRVLVDGREVVADRIHGGGAREDRPIYVFREIRVPPGTLELRVGFEPAEGEAAPPPRERLVLERKLSLEGGEIALVTYAPERGELVLRRAGERRERR